MKTALLLAALSVAALVAHSPAARAQSEEESVRLVDRSERCPDGMGEVATVERPDDPKKVCVRGE